MSSRFEALRDRLLRAGIAPSRVERYLGELADHLADLTAEERRAGPAPGAEARALARLGSSDSLAETMLARPELRSWTARRPWAAYLVAPSLALLLGAVLAIALVVAGVELFRPVGGGSPLLPAWFPYFAIVLSEVPPTLPIFIGWGLAIQAVRRRTSLGWPLLGLAALAILGGAMHFELALPSSAGPGELALAIALLPPFNYIGSAGAHIAANLALTMVPYLAARQRRQGIAA